MKKMSLLSRSIIAIASLALLASYFFPIWRIDLSAPQYPEGLSLYIWFNKLSGDVDIINGLNHYIGMKHINPAMFPELSFLEYIIAFFIVFGLITAITGSRKLLLANIIITLIGAVAAITDFYQWGYDYGHNLDPKAAIQVPGFSYQPPVIGHKQLLNFDAYSYPDISGWIIVAMGAIFIFIYIIELKKNKTTKTVRHRAIKPLHKSMAAAFLLLLLNSCQENPEPFNYGKEACSFCKMTIATPDFGGEVITKKGRIYKFDDMHCLVSFLKSGEVKQTAIAQTVAINYKNANAFLDVDKAAFLVSANLHSPMNGNAAAFVNRQTAANVQASKSGEIVNWQTLYNSIK